MTDKVQPNPVKEALELAVGYITDAMAEAQAEYELNAPYPLRAKQFEARLESINADLEKVQRALTSAVTEIDLGAVRKPYDGPSESYDCNCITCREKYGWNACLDHLVSKYPRVFVDGGK
jgi:hypothetical protein